MTSAGGATLASASHASIWALSSVLGTTSSYLRLVSQLIRAEKFRYHPREIVEWIQLLGQQRCSNGAAIDSDAGHRKDYRVLH
ncbi:hypothetical protein CC85DRAFT_282484, partial [Cutaneotrichosporon oleaginosum]